jgi:hypothetical protein
MGPPIPRRYDRVKEEDSSHHHSSIDDYVVAGPTPQPSYPIAFPTGDNSETIVIIIETDNMPFFTGIPSQSPGRPPPWMPQSSFQTSTSPTATSSPHSAFPDNVPTTSPSSPTVVYSAGGPVPTTTINSDDSGGEPSVQSEEKHGSNKTMPAVTGAAMVVILAIIGCFVFFCLRKRKRERQRVEEVKVKEVKARRQPAMSTNVGASSTFPLYAAPSSHPLPTGPATPPPVILGPIVPGSNGAYYTGIDTSDIVSMNDRIVVGRTAVDRTGLGNPFADGDSLNEEPPPPYRPRSLAPMSRDTSFRVPPPSFTTSQTHLIGRQERSPFADPEDDDAVSDISGPTQRRDHDGMSVVSDMSYQQDPVVTRPTV